ncbi:MAG: hypothetical protein IPG72_00650 [Ardenticatenales bacterium]|jgi:uncharacterized protein (DUF697 family)|nr:hypothetical protein [Ardenticatenales bacterium]
MGALGSGMVVFNLLREVNLREIKREADQPFTLHILGEVGAATRLAEALSAAPGKHGIHPWVRVVPLPLAAPDGLSAPGPNDGFTVALVLNDGVDPDTNARAALSRLRALRIPSLSVVQNDDAVDLVGAATPRPGETARVVLPAGLPGDELVAQLAPALFERLPADDGARVALARQLPALRRNVIASLIDPTARANAMYAATTGLAEWVPILNLPLNAADVIVLTKNQLIMAYKIALAAGKNGQPRDVIGEIVSVLGGGLLMRQIARELVGLIPVVGIVPKVAVAYGGTRVIGLVVERWALEGRRIEGSEVRALLTEATAGARGLAESVVDRVRGRKDQDGDAEARALDRPATHDDNPL